MPDEGRLTVLCSTHGMVIPETVVVDDGGGGGPIITHFCCPQCGEVGASIQDGGHLDIATLMMIDDQ